MDPQFLEYLLSIGAIEEAGVDETGENIYRVTQKAQEVMPDLWERHQHQFNAVVWSLWMKDFISITFDEEGDAVLETTEKSTNEETWFELDKEEEYVLRDT